MIGPLAPKCLVLPRCNSPVWHGLLGEREWRVTKWSGLMTLEELSTEAVPVGIAARSKQFSHQRIPIHPKVLWLLAYLQYSTNCIAPIWGPITTTRLCERNFREFHCIEHSQLRWPLLKVGMLLCGWSHGKQKGYWRRNEIHILRKETFQRFMPLPYVPLSRQLTRFTKCFNWTRTAVKMSEM